MGALGRTLSGVAQVVPAAGARYTTITGATTYEGTANQIDGSPSFDGGLVTIPLDVGAGDVAAGATPEHMIGVTSPLLWPDGTAYEWHPQDLIDWAMGIQTAPTADLEFWAALHNDPDGPTTGTPGSVVAIGLVEQSGEWRVQTYRRIELLSAVVRTAGNTDLMTYGVRGTMMPRKQVESILGASALDASDMTIDVSSMGLIQDNLATLTTGAYAYMTTGVTVKAAFTGDVTMYADFYAYSRHRTPGDP